MDLERLTKGERIVLIASGLLVVASFIPLWATLRIRNLGVARESVWSSVWGFSPKLAVLVALVAFTLTILRAAGSSPALPVPLSVAYMALGGIATALLFIAVLAGPRGGILQPRPFLDIGRGILVFVGLGLAGAIFYGGLLHRAHEASDTTIQ